MIMGPKGTCEVVITLRLTNGEKNRRRFKGATVLTRWLPCFSTSMNTKLKSNVFSKT
ncbi:uncharacterized protein METZ01_LOCUS13576 [marine metagenome]|uniref:Uncharacterized protein n=1 Tax=marine metagenome TaxID=408172 RepID=A0A381P1E5_9ZZZZ